MPTERFDWTFLNKMRIRTEDITDGDPKPRAGQRYKVPKRTLDKVADVLPGFDLSKDVWATPFGDGTDMFDGFDVGQ